MIRESRGTVCLMQRIVCNAIKRDEYKSCDIVNMYICKTMKKKYEKI